MAVELGIRHHGNVLVGKFLGAVGVDLNHVDLAALDQGNLGGDFRNQNEAKFRERGRIAPMTLEGAESR